MESLKLFFYCSFLLLILCLKLSLLQLSSTIALTWTANADPALTKKWMWVQAF